MLQKAITVLPLQMDMLPRSDCGCSTSSPIITFEFNIRTVHVSNNTIFAVYVSFADSLI